MKADLSQIVANIEARLGIMLGGFLRADRQIIDEHFRAGVAKYRADIDGLDLRR